MLFSVCSVVLGFFTSIFYGWYSKIDVVEFLPKGLRLINGHAYSFVILGLLGIWTVRAYGWKGLFLTVAIEGLWEFAATVTPTFFFSLVYPDWWLWVILDFIQGSVFLLIFLKLVPGVINFENLALSTIYFIGADLFISQLAYAGSDPYGQMVPPQFIPGIDTLPIPFAYLGDALSMVVFIGFLFVFKVLRNLR